MNSLFRAAKLTCKAALAISLSLCVLTHPVYPEILATTLANETQEPTLSFYFQNIDIRSLLQIIAKSSGLNFVISDSIKGNVTLSLKNVTWQQALDIILKSHGLASRREGNVMYISTMEEIVSNETKQLQADAQISDLQPLSSEIFQLRYTSATDMATLLKGSQSSLLTSRGQVAIDPRTNSLIVRDTSRSLAEVRRELRRLDVPAKQVVIEARIVTLDTTYEKQLGVRFGLTSPKHFSGSLNGANQIVGGTSPSQTNVGGTVSPTPRLNFNNAATQFSSGANPGSVGLALARLGRFMLDLELSALEEDGHANVISKPRVIASNQQKATIETGQEIPYQEATSSGATSISFKKAVLSLEITPQITPDNKIVLTIKATEDTPGQQIALTAATATVPATLGPPAINTQEVDSQVLLNDNETIVLGGIYKLTQNSTFDRVPFFGSLPFIGNFFRSTTINNQKQELLVFITPKIIRGNHYPPKRRVEKEYAKF